MAGGVAVAFNDDAHRKHHLNETELIGEAEVMETAAEIAGLLGIPQVAVGDDIQGALRQLKAFDVIINLCEGVLGVPGLEKNFALALEMLGIAHTSCDPVATGICADKTLTRQLLTAGAIPVPRAYHGGEGLWIVKPSREDAGIGIEAASVCRTPEEVSSRVALVEARYQQPSVIEEFIDGSELNQAIFAGRLLPPGEIVFGGELEVEERIVGWQSKWDAGSREDRLAVSRNPAMISNVVRERVQKICRDAAGLIGLDMYARFDLRERDGEVFIIDVNPNPDIGRGSGFRKALEAEGIAFRDFLDTLIMTASVRSRR